MAEQICDLKYTIYREKPIENKWNKYSGNELAIIGIDGSLVTDVELANISELKNKFIANSVKIPSGPSIDERYPLSSLVNTVRGRQWKIWRAIIDRNTVGILITVHLENHPILNLPSLHIAYSGIDPSLKDRIVRDGIIHTFHEEINAQYSPGRLISSAIDHFNWRSLRFRIESSSFIVHSVLFAKKVR